jgi:catechol 2,3-dioxygenase-like lactoylglutathione lyase family enzyme
MTAGPFDSQITFCYTRDLATTAAFYEDVLGLTMVLDQGGCRIYRVADEAYLGFCERERMREVGVEFEKAPTMNPDYHIYHCFLRDPNGYLIEIQRFEDPRWPSPR